MSKDKKIAELESLIYNLELDLKKTKHILGELTGRKQSSGPAANHGSKAAKLGRETDTEEGLVIEGVFNGQVMIGPDGKEYSVPANYASKSKLVEGDILKLTIDRQGAFIYKQIAPVERIRLIGHLIKNKDSQDYIVLAGEKVFKVLLASVTYFKGQEGEEAVILVPKDNDSHWAAVENVIKNKNHSQSLNNDEYGLNL